MSRVPQPPKPGARNASPPFLFLFPPLNRAPARPDEGRLRVKQSTRIRICPRRSRRANRDAERRGRNSDIRRERAARAGSGTLPRRRRGEDRGAKISRAKVAKIAKGIRMKRSNTRANQSCRSPYSARLRRESDLELQARKLNTERPDADRAAYSALGSPFAYFATPRATRGRFARNLCLPWRI